MRISFLSYTICVLLLSVPYPGLAEARDHLAGPVPAEVIRVVDGDSLIVRVRVWIDQTLVVSVRVRDIDAPELRGDCDHERWMARRAKAYLNAAVSGGPVTLTEIEGGTYFGRVIARVTTAEGNDVARALMHNDLVVPFRTRKPWC